MERLFNLLSPEDRTEFLQRLGTAMKWRGWDRIKPHGTVMGCHACEFITYVEELAAKYRITFEEFT